MNTIPTQIVDQPTRTLVEATLHTDLPATTLVEVEADWGPVRIHAVRQRISSGVPADQFPEHWHWNWAAKSRNLRFLIYRCLGIECRGQIQGLMMIKTAGCVARLAPDAGRPLIYVDYIEAAPWNLRVLTDAPRFGGVGVRLIEAAVRVSLEEGFHGRVGLHSLPQAEPFYRDTCLMDCLGVDVSYENLSYYELTRERAAEFLSGGGRS